MSGTVYGPAPTPDFVRTEEDRERLIEAMAQGETHLLGIDPNSATWLAVKAHIKEMVDFDYMSTLRNRAMDHGQTQYARGAIDALDCLLGFGG